MYLRLSRLSSVGRRIHTRVGIVDMAFRACPAFLLLSTCFRTHITMIFPTCAVPAVGGPGMTTALSNVKPKPRQDLSALLPTVQTCRFWNFTGRMPCDRCFRLNQRKFTTRIRKHRYADKCVNEDSDGNNRAFCRLCVPRRHA